MKENDMVCELFFSRGQWLGVRAALLDAYEVRTEVPWTDIFDLFRQRFAFTSEHIDFLIDLDTDCDPCTYGFNPREIAFLQEIVEFIFTEEVVGVEEFITRSWNYEEAKTALVRMEEFLVEVEGGLDKGGWLELSEDEWHILEWVNYDITEYRGPAAGMFPYKPDKTREFWNSSSRCLPDYKVNQLYYLLYAQLDMFLDKQVFEEKTGISWTAAIEIIDRLETYLHTRYPITNPDSIILDTYTFTNPGWNILTTTYYTTHRTYCPNQNYNYNPDKDGAYYKKHSINIQWAIDPLNYDLYWDRTNRTFSIQEIIKLYQTFQAQLHAYPTPQHYVNLTGINWEDTEQLLTHMRSYLQAHRAPIPQGPMFLIDSSDWFIVENTNRRLNEKYGETIARGDNPPVQKNYYPYTEDFKTYEYRFPNFIIEQTLPIFTHQLQLCQTPENYKKTTHFDWNEAQHIAQEMKNYLTQTQP